MRNIIEKSVILFSLLVLELSGWLLVTIGLCQARKLQKIFSLKNYSELISLSCTITCIIKTNNMNFQKKKKKKKKKTNNMNVKLLIYQGLASEVGLSKHFNCG